MAARPANDRRLSVPDPQILAQSDESPAGRAGASPRLGYWVAIALLFGLSGVAAFGLVPGTTLETVPTQAVRLDLPLPAMAIVEGNAAGYWHHDRIRRGDTIGSVLSRLGVDDTAALDFLRTNPAARALYRLRPGKALNVETDADGRLLTLHVGHGRRRSPRGRAQRRRARRVHRPGADGDPLEDGDRRDRLVAVRGRRRRRAARSRNAAARRRLRRRHRLLSRPSSRRPLHGRLRDALRRRRGDQRRAHHRRRIREPREGAARVPLALGRRHRELLRRGWALRCARPSCARRWSSRA